MRAISKIAGTIAMVAAAAVVMAGCAPSAGTDTGSTPDPNEKVTLRFAWWGDDARATAYQAAIDIFEKKHPNITVEGSYTDADSHWQKMATEVAGGNAPDIIQFDYRYITDYALRGALLDLNTQKDLLDMSDVNKDMMSAGEIDGKQYAVPYAQVVGSLFYDPAVYAQYGVEPPAAGQTWDEFLKNSQAIAAASGGTMAGSMDFGLFDDWFQIWLGQYGKGLYTPDGKLGYTEKDVQKFWELASSFRDSGAATPASVTTLDNGSNQTAPMTQKLSSSNFFFDSVAASVNELMGNSLALAPWPTDTDSTGVFLKPGQLAAIYAKSDHPQEAAEFVDFWINDLDAAKALGTTRGVPATSAQRDAIEGDLTPAQKLTFDYQASLEGKLIPTPPAPPKGSAAVRTLFQKTYDQVIFGELTPKDAAEQFIKAAPGLLG